MKNALPNFMIVLVLMALGYAAAVYFETRPAPEDVKTVRPDPAPAPSFIPGSEAPDFAFTDLAGQSRTLSDFRGKIIVLNFWASWCAPCVEEFPRLLEVLKSAGDKAVLIALSSDFNDEAIKNFLQRTETPALPANILIARDQSQAVTEGLFQIYRLPETLIIDKDFLLRKKLIGADWQTQDLESLIESLHQTGGESGSAR